MTGGYSLIDCFDVNITSDPVKIEGIFKKYQMSKRKAFLLSNVTINNTQLNDVFSTPYFEAGKVCFPAYDGVIKISDTDYVTFEATADVIADKYLSKEDFLTIESDNTPYVSRTARDGLVKIPQLVGATVAWNQLVDKSNLVETQTMLGITYTNNGDGSYTISGTSTGRSNLGININYIDIIEGHKYLLHNNVASGTLFTHYIALVEYSGATYVTNTRSIGKSIVFTPPSTVNYLRIEIVGAQSADVTVSNITYRPMLFDLTQMFGTTIADYVNSLERTTEGSGLAWLQSYGFFTKDYYAYDAGSLQSVCTSGRKITALDGTVRTYPIDNEELRGLFKLDANNKLYCDGDVYKSSGAVTRNYETRAYQSGDESLADAITDGTNTVVKLSTPTTETADPYINPQRSEGTEEFVDGLTRDVMIPVGNNSTYYKDELFNIIGEYIDSCDDAVIAMIPEGE